MSISVTAVPKQTGWKPQKNTGTVGWLAPEMLKGVAPYWPPKQEGNIFFFPMQAEMCSQEKPFPTGEFPWDTNPLVIRNSTPKNSKVFGDVSVEIQVFSILQTLWNTPPHPWHAEMVWVLGDTHNPTETRWDMTKSLKMVLSTEV